MRLSEQQRKMISEILDPDYGGRLRAVANKVEAVNAPILIIGLGSTGLDALRITKKLIYDNIRRENGSDKPRNIEYLGIGDSIYELRKGFQGMYLNENNGELKTYMIPDVQGVLAHPELLPPDVSSWINTEINSESVINAAGEVRQIGRLMLTMNLGELLTVIQHKIAAAAVGYPVGTPLYLFIFSGISDYVGSGTFLDVPYLVKANVLDGRSVRSTGILFMPDVDAGRIGTDDPKRESYYANGYAALKELDYLMKTDRTEDSPEWEYGNIGVMLAGESRMSPYDICFLMSGKNQYGTMIGTGGDCHDDVVHIAAETVFNFSFEDHEAADPAGFPVRSLLENEAAGINRYIAQLDNLRHPVNYAYSFVGAVSKKLPLDDVMSYLTCKVFQEVEEYREKDSEDKDIDAILNYFKLSRKEMEDLAAAGAARADTSHIRYVDVKNDPEGVVQLYEIAFAEQQRRFDENIRRMTENLERMLDDRDNLINQYFKDPKRGPVFVWQCLCSSERRSVITDLQKIAMDLNKDNMAAAQQLEMLKETANEKLKRLKESSFIFSRRQVLGEYLDAMDKFYNVRRKKALYAQLRDYCLAANSIILEKNNSIYEWAAELMETLAAIFKKYGNIKYVQKKRAIADTPVFIRELEHRMEQTAEFAVDPQRVAADFYEYLFTNTERWSEIGWRNVVENIHNEFKDVVENINNFIYDEFRQVLDHSIDFYLRSIAETQSRTLDDYCTGIITEMKRRAKTNFPMDWVYTAGVVPQPEYSFLSVPDNSPYLLAEAQQSAVNSVRDGEGCIVRQSGIRDRIFMMNVKNATPLSAYSELKKLYESYKAHRDNPGLHLYEVCDYSRSTGRAQDWKRLPSPYPETEWVDFADPVESQINDEYREVLKKALQYGYVMTNPQDQTMTCRTGKPVDWQSSLAQNKIKYPDTGRILPGKAEKAIRQIKTELRDLEARCTSVTVRRHMVTDDARTALKQTYMEMMFIQMFKVRDEVRRMVENHEQCLAVLENLESRTVDEDAMEDYLSIDF